MIRAQRLDTIKNLSSSHDILTWGEIQHILGVSKATAQRDVEILVDSHIVKKTRGGIIFIHNSVDPGELTLMERETANKTSKQQIAAAALEYVRPGSFIMFDSGSTVLELIRSIPRDTAFTAITYSIQTALALAEFPHVDTYLSGGLVRREFTSCHGVFAENMIDQFHADVCFVGADAINVPYGITEHNMYDIRLKQLLIKSSDQVILLADSSKFKTSASMFVASFRDMDVLITNEDAPIEECKTIEADGVTVIKT